MTKLIEVPDHELAEILSIFDEHVSGKTIKIIAEERSLSTRNIDNKLAKARDWYYQRLKETGKREAAKIWKKYERLEERAWSQLDMTADPSWAKTLMEIWKAQRDMMKLDQPPQAPVNTEGQTVIPQIIFNIDDSKYRQIEEKTKNIIDGEVKILKE